MTTNTTIVNRALQSFGTRTTVTDAELANQTSNEAIQANLILTNTRDDLLRMAPWDCAMFTANLNYISSLPGTPENTSAATTLWTPGQPAPPWSYEYQYPVDCLRACYIIPANQAGFAGVPITNAVTGWSPAVWLGAPIRFKVAIDRFYPVTAAAVAAGGTGYVVGDIITLAAGVNTNPPIGAPAQLVVATLGMGSDVATVTVVDQIMDSTTRTGGSYFAPQTNPVVQGSTTGVGTGATFNLTYGVKGDQRVILTDQEYATLAYCRRVTDPNVMDSLFQTAWSNILGAALCVALTGDKQLANGLVQLANKAIADARAVDGNEGLTINDVTPDWIRARGFNSVDYASGLGFDWGAWWPSY